MCLYPVFSPVDVGYICHACAAVEGDRFSSEHAYISVVSWRFEGLKEVGFFLRQLTRVNGSVDLVVCV